MWVIQQKVSQTKQSNPYSFFKKIVWVGGIYLMSKRKRERNIFIETVIEWTRHTAAADSAARELF